MARRRGKERGPDGQRLRRGPFRGDRPLDEDVAPDEHVAGQPGGGEHRGRGVAIEDVKHPDATGG